MTRRDDAIEAAERLLRAEGPEAVTMRRIADELGIRAPSLYKHVGDKAEIEAALQERGLLGLGEALRAADGGLTGLAVAYRAWALANPALYELASRRLLRRELLSPGVEAAAAAPLVAAVAGDEHRARGLWALAHGLVDLELCGRFPPGVDLDATWAAALAGFVTPPPTVS